MTYYDEIRQRLVERRPEVNAWASNYRLRFWLALSVMLNIALLAGAVMLRK